MADSDGFFLACRRSSTVEYGHYWASGNSSKGNRALRWLRTHRVMATLIGFAVILIIAIGEDQGVQASSSILALMTMSDMRVIIGP